jgi:hypothetical protein
MRQALLSLLLTQFTICTRRIRGPRPTRILLYMCPHTHYSVYYLHASDKGSAPNAHTTIYVSSYSSAYVCVGIRFQVGYGFAHTTIYVSSYSYAYVCVGIRFQVGYGFAPNAPEDDVFPCNHDLRAKTLEKTLGANLHLDTR